MTDRRVEFYCVPGEALGGVLDGAIAQGRYDGHLVVSEWADPVLVIERIVAPLQLVTGLACWGCLIDEEGAAWVEYRPGASSAEFAAEFE